MKQFFSAIFILLFVSIFAAGQEKQASWQYYQGAAGEFSAEFPTIPKSSSILETGTKKTLGNLYKAYFNKAFYFVIACETTNCPQFEVVKQLKFRLRYAGNSKLTEKTLDNSALETGFVDSEGFFQRIRQIRGEKSYFNLHTIAENENNPEAERFLNSFRPTGVHPEAGKADPENFENWLVPETFENKTPPTSKSVPNQPNAGPGAAAKSKTPAVSLAIISKPIAGYTEAAVAYQITGQVVLQVKFLSNGTIDTIAPLVKLPFGLTEQAIAAAREMKFTPAMRDGKNISIFKPVLYTFTIY